ncbi:putative bifunctional diguanylate cyclase/phosphodiesterase [Rhodobacter lacus]|uniref:Bifunctional diguanylate cyclase/phosphodiesterase n=1 Tax=Rhodobacter lacus TaxID=1641972 RepID=A0ABW5A7U8_9RHOB
MSILVIDDEASVREAFRLLFSAPARTLAASRADALAEELFGAPAQTTSCAASAEDRAFCPPIAFAAQGLEGVEMVAAALQAGTPYKVAFIDIRMPPGIDGKETARRIRALDPDLHIVIVSAWSDHSVTEITAVAGPADKIFYICKPFEADEVRQMARALIERWDNDTRQLKLLRSKIAELAASEARAQHMASHDFLTGAANRMAFQRALIDRLDLGPRGMFVAFLDLDHFKHVNDTFGHDAGDALLKLVYAALNDTAPDGALVARLGGDEFGILFEGMTPEAAQAACGALVAACSGSFTVFGNSVHIGASCGLVDCDGHADCEAPDLLRYADLALFAAKADGRQTVRFFDKQLDASQQFRQRIEAGLFYALANDELLIHYQPIVASGSLDVIGYEALLRWNSADYGAVPPSVFIPIAEESPVIIALGDWVVERVLREARAWPDKFTSINFSPRQFKRLDFVERLSALARANGIAPGMIQIEVTETALLAHVRHAQKIITELRAQGFRIALDDFGTGYSSISHLKDFAVDCIKIDRSFVDGMNSDRQSAAIVNALAQLANGLGLEIVAEGVEREDQMERLRALGCSHLQGFLFGRGSEPEQLGLDLRAQDA